MGKRKPSHTGRPEDWAWLDALVGQLDEDVLRALDEEPGQQERPALDFFDQIRTPDSEM